MGTLLILLLAAALAGVIAAQLPVRRAARLDPLSALAAEQSNGRSRPHRPGS